MNLEVLHKMAEISATEKMVTPENLSAKLPSTKDPVFAKPPEDLSNKRSCTDEPFPTNLPVNNNDKCPRTEDPALKQPEDLSNSLPCTEDPVPTELPENLSKKPPCTESPIYSDKPENLCINPRATGNPVFTKPLNSSSIHLHSCGNLVSTKLPEDLNDKPPSSEDAVATKASEIHAKAKTSNDLSLTGRQNNQESAAEYSQSQNEDQRAAADNVECILLPVKTEPEDEDMQKVKIKEEFQQTEEEPLVGKLKIKPMASLVETSLPNSQPELHPFFAGFDDHIRSLIINRQPQFSLNPTLLQRPGQFMYYDNSTNMNLKKMLNGHKMLPIPVSRHPAFRPYVPINVPRPPRSQVPFRTSSFSTQTPPMFMETQPDVSAAPSTSYQWLPQSRPPVPKFTPQNLLPVQNLTPPKNLTETNFTPLNSQPTPKYTPPNNLVTPNVNAFNKLSPQNFPLPHNSVLKNVPPPQPAKVSTSSSTDDLENHSSGNAVIIKTEIDLGIDSKEDLQVTLNECNNAGTHFMDTPDAATPTSDSANSNVEVPNIEQPPILTADAVGPPKETLKRSALYDLPSYSTKGSLLCKCCDFRCDRKAKMKKHFETMHTAENFFKCFYCIKKNLPVFPHKTVHDLEHHVGKVHRREKRWQCKNCSKTYKCRASLKSHMEKTCSQSHPYACHKCTFTCLTETGLEKHVRSHEKTQETQICPFCHKTFKKFYLKTHLVTVHAPPDEKPFRCESCNFASGALGALESHYKRTGHDKHVKCDQCDFACRSESGMRSHVENMHDQDDPNKLVCGVDGCQVKFKQIRSVKLHRRMHFMNESELFKCPDKECPSRFLTGQSLRLHIRRTNHHKPFKCTDCVLRFIKEDSLNKHIQSFHVTKIMRKMEEHTPKEPVLVKNVADVCKYVDWMAGSINENPAPEKYNEDSIANFGCWLGISGFGDTKIDCDNQEALDTSVSEGKSVDEGACQEEEDGDEDYHNVVPVTCLVEVKQDEADDSSASSVHKTEGEEMRFSVKKEESEEEEDDPGYQHVDPEVSCLVECQQNAAMDTSTATDCNENEPQDCFPASLIKVEVDKMDVS